MSKPIVTPRLNCVCGMARVATTCNEDLSFVSSKAIRPLPNHKQVRELRRLCRKTANRAQFEGRAIPLRQVVSIVAMIDNCQRLFEFGNTTLGDDLRGWIAWHRAAGADWREEHPLDGAVALELRELDRLLKHWIRTRPFTGDIFYNSALGQSPNDLASPYELDHNQRSTRGFNQDSQHFNKRHVDQSQSADTLASLTNPCHLGSLYYDSTALVLKVDDSASCPRGGSLG